MLFSSGIPKYIFLTAKQLVVDGHVVMKERRKKDRGGGELCRENTRNFEMRYRRLLLQRLGRRHIDLQQEYDTPPSKDSTPRSGLQREASNGQKALDEDSSDEDDTEVRYVDDEVVVALIALLKKLNQQRMALGLEPDEVFISPQSDADQ